MILILTHSTNSYTMHDFKLDMLWLQWCPEMPSKTRFTLTLIESKPSPYSNLSLAQTFIGAKEPSECGQTLHTHTYTPKLSSRERYSWHNLISSLISSNLFLLSIVLCILGKMTFLKIIPTCRVVSLLYFSISNVHNKHNYFYSCYNWKW